MLFLRDQVQFGKVKWLYAQMLLLLLLQNRFTQLRDHGRLILVIWIVLYLQVIVSGEARVKGARLDAKHGLVVTDHSLHIL